MPVGIQHDFTGRRFGRITVLGYDKKVTHYHSVWRCQCECGTVFLRAGRTLARTKETSCGCGHGLKISDPITHEQLKKLLRYNRTTGQFIARRKWHRKKVGDIVGCVDINSGYCHVSVGGVTYYGHVLAYFYVKGVWPTVRVDHENRDRANNRWSNLRAATDSQNNANHPVRKDSQSGFKGVTRYFRNPAKWKAYIIVKGKQKILGYEDCPEAAARLYDVAARQVYGEFARLNFGDAR